MDEDSEKGWVNRGIVQERFWLIQNFIGHNFFTFGDLVQPDSQRLKELEKSFSHNQIQSGPYSSYQEAEQDWIRIDKQREGLYSKAREEFESVFGKKRDIDLFVVSGVPKLAFPVYTHEIKLEQRKVSI